MKELSWESACHINKRAIPNFYWEILSVFDESQKLAVFGWFLKNSKNKNLPIFVIHQKCFEYLNKSWILRIYWCDTHFSNSIPSPVFRISHFCKKNQKVSHNHPNFEIFPIKLVSLNKSCILRSHWCQNHLKMSNPSDFLKN